MVETTNRPRAGSRLRQLALDYAEGRISRSSYLRARTQFLDGLGAYHPEPSNDGVTDGRTRRIAAPRPSPPESRRGLRTGAISGIVALIAIAGGAWLLPLRLSPPSAPDIDDQQPSASEAPQASAADPSPLPEEPPAPREAGAAPAEHDASQRPAADQEAMVPVEDGPESAPEHDKSESEAAASVPTDAEDVSDDDREAPDRSGTERDDVPSPASDAAASD